MKRILVILFCLISSAAYCQQQVTTIRGVGPDGKTRNIAVTASGAVETSGSVSGVASVSTDINALADQQASETLQILAAQASTTTKVTDAETGILALSAQQASESIDTLAAIASTTLETASGNVSINNSIQEVKTSVDSLSSQQASESSDILDAQASTTTKVTDVENLLKPLVTPTNFDIECGAVATSVVAVAGRVWINVQNKSTTEEVYLDHVNTVTPGNKTVIFPGSNVLLPINDTVPVYIISSTTVMVNVIQAVK